MNNLSVSDFERATALVSTFQRPLLLTHAKPDGDAIGSVLAMRDLLRQGGADAFGVFFGKIPARYAPFSSFQPVGSWGEGVSTEDLDRCDGVIVLDTCSYTQLEPVADWLRRSDRQVLAVDHHKTRDDLATHHLIDESAAANCLILFEWARAAGWTITEPVARAMFAGIAMDTGWFRHSNTDARVFDAVSAIASTGVSPSTLYEGLYHQDSIARVRLLAEAVSTLEFHSDDQLAVMELTQRVFRNVGALMSDSEDVVNEPLRIGSAIVSVLFVEQADGVIRVNLRSKPPAVTGGVDVDVAEIARTLGGGGHARAAGVRMPESIEKAKKCVIPEIIRLLPKS